MGTVVCKKFGEHYSVTGVEHKIVRHSPDGFSWGYYGSGCAELALNILDEYVDEEVRDHLYQYFKEDVIARIPDNGGVITDKQIREWLAVKGVRSFKI